MQRTKSGKERKKILLSVGTIAAVVATIATVVACGSESFLDKLKDKAEINKYADSDKKADLIKKVEALKTTEAAINFTSNNKEFITISAKAAKEKNVPKASSTQGTKFNLLKN